MSYNIPLPPSNASSTAPLPSSASLAPAVAASSSAAAASSSSAIPGTSSKESKLIRVLFFYDVYAFTNEELWYGVQWNDRSCSEMKLEELLQHDGQQALLDAYRKPSIPWRESHGYSINNGRLRFDATTAKHLIDANCKHAAARR